jgi:hypothetical protein
MPLGAPMIWREPKKHISDCYFCLTHVSGHTSKTRDTICYPNLPLALRPVPHGEGLPVLKRPELGNLQCDKVMDWNGQTAMKMKNTCHQT